jgi:hypothetical protein
MADSRDVTSVRRVHYVLLGVLVSALVGGCGFYARRRAPEAVLAAYAEALARGDAAAARRLLTADDRRALPAGAYAAKLARDAREARELGQRIARAPAPRVYARLTLEDGSEVELERGPSGFRLRDPLTRLYGQSSPREALLSFIRAVEHERWDVLLSLMPRADREGLDAARLGALLSARREALTRTAARLAAARDAPIEVVGDRATMPYRESFTARFVREDALWKVEDPD